MSSFVRLFSKRKKQSAVFSDAVSEGIRETFRAMGYRVIIAGIISCLSAGCIKDPLSSPVEKMEPENSNIINTSFKKPDLHANCRVTGESASWIVAASLFLTLIIAIPLNQDRVGQFFTLKMGCP